MNNSMRWDLKSIYSSYESDEFTSDIELLKSYVKELEELTLIKPTLKEEVNFIEDYILLQGNIRDLYHKLYYYCYLILSTDSSNEIASRSLGKINTIYSSTINSVNIFENYLVERNNLRESISRSQLLENHSFFLNDIVNRSKYTLSDREELLISKMKSTGSELFNSLWSKLITNLKVEVDVDGQQQELPLSIVNSKLDHSAPSQKRTIYNSELEAYKKIDTSVATCLNGIKGEVLTITNLRGYDSPLDETLEKYRVSKKTLSTLINTVNDHLHIFQNFYRHKAHVLDDNDQLQYYRRKDAVGNIHMNVTYDEAMNYITQQFTTYSEDLGNFATKAFENRWIDAEPRKGKNPGGFCYSIDRIKESRILINYNGNFSDVGNLAHELGHAYHFYKLQNEYPLNRDYTPPISETASTFFETFIIRQGLNSAAPEEALTILDKDLSTTIGIITDVYSAFLFEKELFEKRKDHSLSVEELKTLTLQCQQKVFGDSIDYNSLHPYIWLKKPHLYYAEYNFYNYPYLFGILLSKGLYQIYLEDNETFIKKFEEFLSSSGKYDVDQLAKIMDIDLESKRFWQNSIKLIENDINKFIELCEE